MIVNRKPREIAFKVWQVGEKFGAKLSREFKENYRGNGS